MLNKKLITRNKQILIMLFASLLLTSVNVLANAEDCANDFIGDLQLKKGLPSILSLKDFNDIQMAAKTDNANGSRYMLSSTFYRLGYLVKKDLHKSFALSKRVSLANSKNIRSYAQAQHDLGWLSLLCGEYLGDRNYIKYFQQSAKYDNAESKYFVATQEFFTWYEKQNVNEKYPIHFKEYASKYLLKLQVASESSLSIFEAYFLKKHFSDWVVEEKNTEKLTKILLKSEFFDGCAHINLQRNLSMPFHKFKKERLKLIQSLNPQFYKNCTQQ
ncbi:hypothetical protein [Psychromonas sp. Urea-02u-13]|uniref:hypothetical protein n=1 Tax=Psychromonas sp. Urea-02u-13 TaxID=2058326 RepID=UPI000C32A260|nr:hypothetical protein [Psychromonas sp. Urea-02u-13]PKG37406.1 hypothetical protein CXF74_18960 [Psychromonas sp. Urea-02u-13]